MSKLTYQEKACLQVPAFKEICERLTRKFVISGKSRSCVLNYLLQVSKLVLHTGRTPLDLSIDELEGYLYYLHLQEDPSYSSFKHLIYGLRHIYSQAGYEALYLSLPPIKKSKKLPVVFSRKEVRHLLSIPKLLK